MFISLPHFSNMGHLYIWINSCETKNPNENAKFSTDTARDISLFLTALYTYIFFEILFFVMRIIFFILIYKYYTKTNTYNYNSYNYSVLTWIQLRG